MRKLLFIIPILILLASCAAQKQIIEVPVETVKTEYIHDIIIDSIIERDSIDRWRDGDTVYIFKEHTKYRYLNRTDTICKTDTITKTIKVPKEVKINYLYWWQEALMWSGLVSILMLVGFIIFKIKH